MSMNFLIDIFRTQTKKLVLGISVIVIIITRVIPISSHDIYGDGAINTFRALGWFDWLGFSGQSTPFEWFGYIPVWAKLSFHDAPPASFFIQHLFFSVLGDHIYSARLPFVLAGIVSIIIVYCFLKKLEGQRVALLAVTFYSVVSYSVWSGHSMYIEAILELFIIASILFGGLYLFKEQKLKYLYLWSVFTALALMTKYTALFLLPPIAIYLFIFKSQIAAQWKHLLFSTLIFLAILSPVIIYNFNVYQSRGHFDAALSSVLGMHPDDFGIISDRTALFDPIRNIKGMIVTVAHNMSF